MDMEDSDADTQATYKLEIGQMCSKDFWKTLVIRTEARARENLFKDSHFLHEAQLHAF